MAPLRNRSKKTKVFKYGTLKPRYLGSAASPLKKLHGTVRLRV